jgi:hypothetical protein
MLEWTYEGKNCCRLRVLWYASFWLSEARLEFWPFQLFSDLVDTN